MFPPVRPDRQKRSGSLPTQSPRSTLILIYEDAPGLFCRGHPNHSGSVILALTSCLRLFLASDGRLLIMLSLTNLLLDTGLRTASLEAAQRAVQ